MYVGAVLCKGLETKTDTVRANILLVAQVNKHLPRTFGDGIIHQSHIDAMVQADEPLHELSKGALSDEEVMIGKVVAENLVDDGATLQMGEEKNLELFYHFL